MKRTALLRRTPLRRSRKANVFEPGKEAWKQPVSGYCQCGCNPAKFSMHLERHHVVQEQVVRREGGWVWATANSMLLAPAHHANHTSGFRKIPLASVPPAALEFARGLLGEGRAEQYFQRRYETRP